MLLITEVCLATAFKNGAFGRCCLPLDKESGSRDFFKKSISASLSRRSFFRRAISCSADSCSWGSSSLAFLHQLLTVLQLIPRLLATPICVSPLRMRSITEFLNSWENCFVLIPLMLYFKKLRIKIPNLRPYFSF